MLDRKSTSWIDVFVFLFLVLCQFYLFAPKVGTYSVLLCDFALFGMFVWGYRQGLLEISVLTKLIMVLVGTFSIGLILVAESCAEWSALLPLLFGLILSTTTPIWKRIEPSKLFKYLVVALLFATIPLYIELLFQNKFSVFHHNFKIGDRYSGWMVMTNRFNMFVFAYFWGAVLILEKYNLPAKKRWEAGLLLLISIPIIIASSRFFVFVLFLHYLLFFAVLVYIASLRVVGMLMSGFAAVMGLVVILYYNESIVTFPIRRLVWYFNEILNAESIGTFIYEIAEERKVLEGLKVFYENKLIGVGLGKYPNYSASGHSVHNIFVSTLVETGLIGFTGLLIFISGVFSKILEYKKELAFLLAFFLLFSLSINLFGNYLFQRCSWIFIVILFALGKDSNFNGLKNV